VVFGVKPIGILFNLARPDIYRNNAFRVLGIPITASSKEAYAKLRKLEREEKFGVATQKGQFFLPLDPPPDLYTRQAAYQKLTDPETRLLEEIFWFWPISTGFSGNDDDALVAMKKGDYAGAICIWEQHETQSSESNVSAHNLALLYHVLALDLEYAGIKEPLSPEQVKQKEAYWKQSLDRWRTLFEKGEFWKRVATRIKELDDPRLNARMAQGVRTRLPEALLTINAKLAIEAMQNGNDSDAAFQVELINNSGFDEALVDKAIGRALTSLRASIKLICTTSDDNMNQNPENGDKTAEDIITQTAKLLRSLDVLLPAEHAIHQTVHDQIAEQVRTAINRYLKHSENWEAALPLLQQAFEIAASPDLRGQIESEIEIVKHNILFKNEYETCWFCKQQPADAAAAVNVNMHGDVHNDGFRVSWRHGTIAVPRCQRCKKVHGRKKTIVWVTVLLAIFLAVMLGLVFNALTGFITFVLVLIMGLSIGPHVKRSNIKPQKYKMEFPAVQQRVTQGWREGNKPPQAN